MGQLTEWARTAPADDFWFAVAVLLLLSIGGFIGAFVFFRRKRIMEDTPTSKIRSAAQGYVELIGHGEIMEGEPITAPLTEKICTWYSYKIEQKRKSGKKTRWVTIKSGISDELFILNDGTGKCVIDPEDASVTPTVTDVWYGSSSWPRSAPGKNSAFLAVGRYRYTEKRMHPDDPLFAIGLYSTVGGAGGEFNVSSDVRDLLKEWKQDSNKMLQRFDKNKDGQIDMNEWQSVRKAALDEVMAHHNERKTAPPVNMMTKTCDYRRPYLLSAISQDSLIRLYHYYSIGLIILFFISGALSTVVLTQRLAGG